MGGAASGNTTSRSSRPEDALSRCIMSFPLSTIVGKLALLRYYIGLTAEDGKPCRSRHGEGCLGPEHLSEPRRRTTCFRRTHPQA